MLRRQPYTTSGGTVELREESASASESVNVYSPWRYLVSARIFSLIDDADREGVHDSLL